MDERLSIAYGSRDSRHQMRSNRRWLAVLTTMERVHSDINELLRN